MRPYHLPVEIILISKYFLKNVVSKNNFTFIFKSLFCNLAEIQFQSFKTPFKFTFHGVFLLTQDHIFCSDSYRGSVKFYRDTTQILWLLPPTQAINDDNDCQHILNGILTHIQFNLTNSNLNRKCSKGHINLDLPRNHVYPLRWDLIFNYMFVS